MIDMNLLRLDIFNAIGFGIGLLLPFIASVLWDRHTARKRRARRQARAARRAYREVA